jgi:hypothetical protein
LSTKKVILGKRCQAKRVYNPDEPEPKRKICHEDAKTQRVFFMARGAIPFPACMKPLGKWNLYAAQIVCVGFHWFRVKALPS